MAGGFFAMCCFVAVSYDTDWQMRTGIAGLVLIGVALPLQWRMVAIFALAGACLFPLFLLFIRFNFCCE